MFGEDHMKAVAFLQRNGTYFEIASKRFGNDPRFLKSIVFPELVRYHQLSDLFETTALEWLYVEGGSKAADFSIGHLQMKPSFIETLEGFVSSVRSLREEFGFIILNGSGPSFRKQRIARLKQLHWQVIYLSCFEKAARHRFSSITHLNPAAELRFLATVYNTGLLSDEAQIRKMMDKPVFPYGPRFDASVQVPYSDVAVDYFLHRS
jgi:hypothetical protein